MPWFFLFTYFVLLCMRLLVTTRTIQIWNSHLNKFCSFSGSLYGTCHWYYGLTWPFSSKNENTTATLYVLLSTASSLYEICILRWESSDKYSTRWSWVLYLSRDSHQELYMFIQTKWQCFKCFIVFYTIAKH